MFDFEKNPKPWKVGVKARGNGRFSYAVIDAKDALVLETNNDALTATDLAELIVSAVNAFEQPSEAK